MRNSGYANSKLFQSNNGFYPTAVSSFGYDVNNPNAKITMRVEEMVRKTEEISKKINPDLSSQTNISKIKRKTDFGNNTIVKSIPTERSKGNNSFSISHNLDSLVNNDIAINPDDSYTGIVRTHKKYINPAKLKIKRIMRKPREADL